LPFGDFVQAFADEVARADAVMQMRQRQAWTEMIRALPLFAGSGELAALGIAVDLRFSLALVDPRWWERLWRWLRRSPAAPATYTLAPPTAAPAGLIEVHVHAARGGEGRFTVDYDAGPQRRALESAHVRHPRA
jgi:hypothetical protein